MCWALSYLLHWVPRAAVTKYHKRSSSDHRNPEATGYEPGVHRWFPPRAGGGPNPGGLAPAAGDLLSLRFQTHHLSSVSISPGFLPGCGCVSVCTSSQAHQAAWARAHLAGLTSTTSSAKTLLPNKVRFTGQHPVGAHTPRGDVLPARPEHQPCLHLSSCSLAGWHTRSRSGLDMQTAGAKTLTHHSTKETVARQTDQEAPASENLTRSRILFRREQGLSEDSIWTSHAVSTRTPVAAGLASSP